ncbi:MAG: hypothetical protein HPY80_11350 [Bacteroidales bacterium]|jgi:hypothetical protein|nr:hypothetical protein [Bacteroidales bacterium]NPV37249.1 hypothetical protein [Bacteroidales bacterium]
MKKGIFHSMFFNLSVTDPLKEYYFFRELGYDKVNCPLSEGFCLTDGTLRLLITPERSIPTGIVLAGQNLEEMKLDIKQRGFLLVEGAEIQFPRISGPSGTTLSLIEMDEQWVPPLKGSPVSLCGTFFEISVETIDYEATVEFWERMGLEVIYGDKKGNWVTLADDFIKIGFYRQGTVEHKFRSPAITYFEPDMQDRIRLLQQLQVDIARPLGECKNGPVDAILETPGGYNIFLFKS